ncbi:galanin receptor type 2 [Clonorchis sinensis]|uniref:Galanin receptor type 2 n=2 Tax=Clonorchis sinensis TaxID=79923 RepID=G7Y388_CLOSI|nr:galanin receptor type 2 [Clonorchis sinensis]
MNLKHPRIAIGVQPQSVIIILYFTYCAGMSSVNYSDKLNMSRLHNTTPSTTALPHAWRLMDIFIFITSCLFVIIAAVGLLGNLLVICVLTSTSNRLVYETFCIGLACTDFTYLVLTSPITVSQYYLNSWIFGLFWCKVFNFVVQMTHSKILKLIPQPFARILQDDEVPFTPAELTTLLCYGLLGYFWVNSGSGFRFKHNNLDDFFWLKNDMNILLKGSTIEKFSEGSTDINIFRPFYSDDLEVDFVYKLTRKFGSCGQSLSAIECSVNERYCSVIRKIDKHTAAQDDNADEDKTEKEDNVSGDVEDSNNNNRNTSDGACHENVRKIENNAHYGFSDEVNAFRRMMKTVTRIIIRIPIMSVLIVITMKVTVFSTAFMLLGLTTSRFLSVVLPWQNLKMTELQARLACLAAWCVGILFALPVIVVHVLVTEQLPTLTNSTSNSSGNLTTSSFRGPGETAASPRQFCREQFPSQTSRMGYQLFVLLSTYVLPFVAIIIMNSMIVYKLQQKVSLTHSRNRPTIMTSINGYRLHYSCDSTSNVITRSRASQDYSIMERHQWVQRKEVGYPNTKSSSGSCSRGGEIIPLRSNRSSEELSRRNNMACSVNYAQDETSCALTSKNSTAQDPQQSALSPIESVRMLKEEKQRRRRSKATKLVVLVTTLWCSCWLPTHIINSWFYFDEASFPFTPSMKVAKLLSQTLSFAASCVNPLVYGIMTGTFKNAISKRLPRKDFELTTIGTNTQIHP